MKTLPTGKYALAIAHPGHELRLHGFLEQARPFVFILTDNSEEHGQDLMWDAIKVIDRATKQGMNISPEQLKDPFMRKVLKMSHVDGENKAHYKDSQIAHEVLNLHTDFLDYYVDFIVDNLIRYKIDYLVCDSSEDYHITHEVVRMLCELAVSRVQQRTGDKVELLDFALSEPFDSITHEHCIRIELSEEAVQRKLHAICTTPFGIQDLKPNINMSPERILELRKMDDRKSFLGKVKYWIDNLLVLFQLKDTLIKPEHLQQVYLKNELFRLNPDFFNYEILRPARTFRQTENYKSCIQPVYGKILHKQLASA
jgi:hypothetical protein